MLEIGSVCNCPLNFHFICYCCVIIITCCLDWSFFIFLLLILLNNRCEARTFYNQYDHLSLLKKML